MSALFNFSENKSHRLNMIHQFKVENQGLRIRNEILKAREIKEDSILFKDILFPENIASLEKKNFILTSSEGVTLIKWATETI